ncbi:MAG: hypothetical protein M1833_004168 [Piccolia ochrophora]|nr:MAG: hypothetical protein M1833_004168 [Piccolia ochrophora]
MSFIITRSDLLAPLKAQVDSLMPYFIGVLRDALDASGKDVRLGNVRCVSAKRGWWTKELKEDIWRRGGGGWMVGKVNVGKSNLFETVFPKGHLQQVDLGEIRRETGGEGVPLDQTEEAHINHISHPENPAICESHEQLKLLDETSLLPPAQSSTPFPQMPVVSSLPGTTASPIRIPFGPAGKGELIDLPGLARSNLDTHVQPAHRETLVMRSRAKPEQIVIKPSQSLLVGGGLIRITPKIPADTVLLAYPFLPLSTHVTATEKAVEIQTQKRESGIESILTEGVGEQISAAGTFRLDWDVTKQRSGPLTRPSAVGLQTGQLPYRVLATDILVEGCGWIELATQVRKKHLDPIHDDDVTSGRENPTAGSRLNGEACPEVEIFTPHGKYIGERRPMNAWLLGSKETRPKAEIKGRPRTSVKGQKKGQKLARSMTS